MIGRAIQKVVIELNNGVQGTAFTHDLTGQKDWWKDIKSVTVYGVKGANETKQKANRNVSKTRC